MDPKNYLFIRLPDSLVLNCFYIKLYYTPLHFPETPDTI